MIPMPPAHSSSSAVGYRLLVFALLTSLGTTCAAVMHPATPSAGDATQMSIVFAYGWIASQSFLLTVPAILLGGWLARSWPRLGWSVGAALAEAVLVVVICDIVTFRWIGERFVSRAMWRILTSLRGSLSGHVTSTMIVSGAVLFIACAAYTAMAWYFSAKIADACSRSNRMPRSTTSLGISVFGCLLISSPAIWNGRRTVAEMAEHSARHPVCAFGLVGYHGVGRRAAMNENSNPERSSMFATAVTARDHDQRQLHVDLTSLDDTGQDARPDVLMVVIESFRPELVAAEVMPNLWGYAENGIFCRQHFSGGNATNHGMFSLLNGLEAIWYERDVRYSPLLNRLFHQSGYELGFFGGHNDWRTFLMDGYINDAQYDVFEIDEPNWLESDRRSTQRAAMFLGRTGQQTRGPRLAVLYLYSTHANYHSYLQDQVFQPAADDRFLIPFSKSASPAIWNRYKNSARSIDRFLAAVMNPHRVIIVTGDHGESFLEDGVCGHGVRISKYENMTPAVVYVPGAKPRLLDAPTMHADLLPTLLSAVGIRVRPVDAFDGDDLLTTSDDDLADRVFATRNYLSDDVAIIGPWTDRNDQPFGYRASVSLRRLSATALGAIDPSGTEQTADLPENSIESAFNRWLQRRFGEL